MIKSDDDFYLPLKFGSVSFAYYLIRFVKDYYAIKLLYTVYRKKPKINITDWDD
jgi:hypothetical protein